MEYESNSDTHYNWNTLHNSEESEKEIGGTGDPRTNLDCLAHCIAIKSINLFHIFLCRSSSLLPFLPSILLKQTISIWSILLSLIISLPFLSFFLFFSFLLSFFHSFDRLILLSSNSPVCWGCRIHRQHLCRVARLINPMGVLDIT